MQVSQVAIKNAAATKGAKQAPKGKTVKAAAPAIKFAIAQGVGRPSAGTMLKAHTAAFLSLSGMAKGGEFPKATATKVIGATAVNYHLGQCNFEQTENGLKLTAKGEFLFNEYRQIDPEAQKKFEAYMQSGELNPEINVKNSAAVVKL